MSCEGDIYISGLCNGTILEGLKVSKSTKIDFFLKYTFFKYLMCTLARKVLEKVLIEGILLTDITKNTKKYPSLKTELRNV